MGDFQWAGKLFKGVHEQLVTRERFSDVQAVLTTSLGLATRNRSMPSWAS